MGYLTPLGGNGGLSPLGRTRGIVLDPAVKTWQTYNTAQYGGAALPGELAALNHALRMIAFFRSKFVYWLIAGGASVNLGNGGKNWCTTPLLYLTTNQRGVSANGSVKYIQTQGFYLDGTAGANGQGLNIPGFLPDSGLTLSDATVLWSGQWATAADANQIRPFNGGSTWIVKYAPGGFGPTIELRSTDSTNATIGTAYHDVSCDAFNGVLIGRLGCAGVTLDRDEARHYRHPSLTPTTLVTASTAHTGHLTDALTTNTLMGQGAVSGDTFITRQIACAHGLTTAEADQARAAMDYLDRFYLRVA